METVSVVLQYSDQLNYDVETFNSILESLVNQNYPAWEALIIDSRKDRSRPPALINDKRIRLISGDFPSRAGALNRAVSQASGSYIMLVDNVDAPVFFKLSTLETFVLCCEKNADTGYMYSDYSLIEKDGSTRMVHLLTQHKGRVRDNMDYGPVLFFPAGVLREAGGLNEKYTAADLYDLRLRLSEGHSVYHINAARNGCTYTVHSVPKSHNVFDYLMAGRDVQLEMEDALTEHLKRIGACLLSGFNYKAVTYTPEEEKSFETCLASIVIPVFGREEFIGTAIESVQAQTVSNVEVIIVANGGPEDSAVRGVKPYLPGGGKYDPGKPAVRLFIEDINNLGFCLNKGLREARGKYYIQLDSDDRLKPDAVEKIAAVFDTDPHIGMVIGSYEVWVKDDADGKISRMKEIPAVTHEEWTEKNGRNNLLRINGAGAPRAAHIKVIRELGYFGMNDTEDCRNYGEDYDLVLRISEQYRIGRVWEPVYDVIRHSGGTDHTIDQRTVDQNDNAKDKMRLHAIERRIRLNSITH